MQVPGKAIWQPQKEGFKFTGNIGNVTVTGKLPVITNKLLILQ